MIAGIMPVTASRLPYRKDAPLVPPARAVVVLKRRLPGGTAGQTRFGEETDFKEA